MLSIFCACNITFIIASKPLEENGHFGGKKNSKTAKGGKE